MDSDDTMSKVPWETPATTALTDSESRADQADVGMDNGTSISPSY